MSASPEWITAIGTVVTALVIAASACAALIQIRHMRGGNQIAAYNECRETMESEEFRNAIQFVRSQLPERLKDPSTSEKIVAGGLSGDYVGIRLLANFFETMGLYVRTGLIEERLACELWSALVLMTWNALRPITAAARKQLGPGIWVNFEYMAFLAKRHDERFPNGEYPRGVERMPLEEPATR
jgi:hypothetical protein